MDEESERDQMMETNVVGPVEKVASNLLCLMVGYP